MEDKNRTRIIIRNTIALYLRMILTMLVSLYTSRVVLNVLGAADYGVYNVVGSIVVMFYFLNGAMAGGTQRFLNYEMGTGTPESLRKTFNASLTIHIGIAGIILVLAETVGLWFVNYKLVISPDQKIAANWVYQFSILSAMVSLTQVPYTAAIIAHERMKIYGYVGILEALLKLTIVFVLIYLPFNKLILYGILTFSVSFIIASIYRIFCIRHYTETHFQIVRDPKIYKSLIGFSSWNLIGNLSGILTNQGQNIILNIFYGPIANAARAIATSVNGVVLLLVNGFTTALNPQITKSWASNEKDYFMTLVLRSSKFSFYLLLVLAAPVYLKIYEIITIWLVNPPEYSFVFCRLALIDCLVYCVTIPLLTAAQATGKIKVYESVVSLITILNLPISYVLLNIGFPPTIIYIVTISTSVCALLARIIILRNLIKLSFWTFVGQVLLPCWGTFTVAIGIMSLISDFFGNSIINLIIFTIITEFLIFICCLSFGFTKAEKFFFKNYCCEIIKKLR